jgi:DNA-binding NtrC family response regulator
MKARVLIVDDEPRMAASLRTALERSGFECECAGNGVEALLALEARRADVVVSDRRMPEMDGLELLREVKTRYGELPFVMMTAYADVPSAVEAMRAGAFDYVTKPFDNDEIRAQVARAVELVRLKRENAWLRQETAAYTPDSMIAESAASRDLLELVRRVARASSSVLVQGESGTGKEFVARLLHYWSDRVGAPFVAVNCAALAPGVLESELFGHERGAFTGALQARAGCFERAHGGTLFLDEIGEISGDFQAKLLRVLQDGEVQRVGSSKTRHVEVRVVAATNRNLRDAIAAGRFREDLYFRLNVIPIQIEPLRARREDILPLARFFLARHAERPLTLSAEAEERLHRHEWPGNVRELENAIERAAILARGESLEPEDLLLEPAVLKVGPAGGHERANDWPIGVLGGWGGARAAASDAPPIPEVAGADGTLQEAVDRATEERVRGALRETSGRRAEAARLLGVERTTLYRLIKRFGIED